jgi:hypothetical protein
MRTYAVLILMVAAAITVPAAQAVSLVFRQILERRSPALPGQESGKQRARTERRGQQRANDFAA